jgi:peptidoglycan/LPS O-acetylase OafA/YrhL
MGLDYRREIDGLRAIAVLAVVLGHALGRGAGYVGVDIFFVISGYLITSLLLAEQAANGRIRLAHFYARRVRRILPAAAVTIVVTMLLCWCLLPPDELAHSAQSAAAASVFAANLFFQLHSGGYFDSDSATMPLLHLWSLSVEEQFYFFWPALLPFLRSRRAIGVLVVASLAFALVLESRSPQAAFYQMPARLWELAVGAWLVAAPPRRGAPPRWLGMLGIAIMLVSILLPVGDWRLANVVAAVLGSALLLYSLHEGAGNRLLASAPMVGIGLVSYSFYLWHWPLLALYRATSPEGQGVGAPLALCLLALLLAIVSWRYVEQPFRRMRAPAGRTVAIGIGVSLLLALGSLMLSRHALAPDFNDPFPEATRAERDLPGRGAEGQQCHSLRDDPARMKCPPRSRTVVWGDSMAYSWLPALPGATVATRDACAPLLDALPPAASAWRRRCREANAQVVGLDADTFVLAARWQTYGDFDLRPTLERLRGKRVFVIGPTPQMPLAVPDCLRGRDLRQCTLARATYEQWAAPERARLRAQAAPYPNVQVLDMDEFFCTKTQCPPLREGVPLYWDTHHISARAARASGLGRRVAEKGVSP